MGAKPQQTRLESTSHVIRWVCRGENVAAENAHWPAAIFLSCTSRPGYNQPIHSRIPPASMPISPLGLRSWFHDCFGKVAIVAQQDLPTGSQNHSQ